jgi:hypothetical protein
MNIGRRRIDSQLYAQGLADRDRLFESRFKLVFANNFGDALREIRKLLLDGFKSGGRQSILLRYDHNTAAVKAVAAFEHDACGFGINPMLFAQNALGESILGVAILDSNHGL